MEGIETKSIQLEVATVLDEVATMKDDRQAIRAKVADIRASHEVISKNLKNIINRQENILFDRS